MDIIYGRSVFRFQEIAAKDSVNISLIFLGRLFSRLSWQLLVAWQRDFSQQQKIRQHNKATDGNKYQATSVLSSLASVADVSGWWRRPVSPLGTSQSLRIISAWLGRNAVCCCEGSPDEVTKIAHPLWLRIMYFIRRLLLASVFISARSVPVHYYDDDTVNVYQYAHRYSRHLYHQVVSVFRLFLA